MKKNSSPATNSRSVVKPKPHAEAIDRDVETLPPFRETCGGEGVSGHDIDRDVETLPPFRGATQTELRDHMDSNDDQEARAARARRTQTELRDHMDSNKPVLFIPTEALGVVSDALKKWEAQQMEAKQPSTLRDSCVSGQVAGPLRATPACFATSPGLVLASGQVAGPLRATPPRALLPSMIDRAHDRVSTLRDKLQGLHERLGPVLRPSTPQPVNGCSAVEDVSVMPDAVQSVYALGARLNELIEHVNDLLDRVET